MYLPRTVPACMHCKKKTVFCYTPISVSQVVSYHTPPHFMRVFILRVHSVCELGSPYSCNSKPFIWEIHVALYCKNMGVLLRCVTGSIILHSSSFHEIFYSNGNNSGYKGVLYHITL